MRIPAPLVAFCAIFLALPIDADETRYEAVWHQGTGTSLTSAPQSRDAFISTGDQLVKQKGLHLIDVETLVKNGHRFYVGLFTEGTGGNLFSGPLSPVQLRQTMKERRAQNLRLVDFEIFRLAGGGTRYLGVWRPGSGEELLTGPLEFSAFKSRGEKLTKRGLRLIDVEVENMDGRLLYSGLFRSGTGANWITEPLTGSAFSAKRDQMVAQGVELVDVERVETGGQQRFVGVWSTGPGESRLSKLRNFSSFFVFSQSQVNNGKRAIDVELVLDKPAPGGGPQPPQPLPNPSFPPQIPEPPSPALPPNVVLVGGDTFRIDWSILKEGMPRIEIPAAYLPDFLPKVNGEIVLPTETVCGFNFVQVTKAFWQISGDSEFDEPPFKALPDVSVQDETSYLAGIKLWGPVLGCEGTNQQWTFPLPLTTGGPFNPQNVEGLSLVIQLDPKTNNPDTSPRIEFTPPYPDAPMVTAAELWDDGWIQDLMDITKELDEIDALNGQYCDIAPLIEQICKQLPTLCPTDDPGGGC